MCTTDAGGPRAARRCLAAAWAALLLALATAVTAGAGERAARYRLNAGDRIAVTIYGHEDLSGEFRIDEAGAVALPLVGPLVLGALSPREAEQVIVRALRPDYLKRPRVAVAVLGHRPFYILGEVENPGSYPYERGLTVMEAVALAGGYTDRAGRDELYVVRGDARRRRERAEEITPVLPGDTVRVPERFF